MAPPSLLSPDPISLCQQPCPPVLCHQLLTCRCLTHTHRPPFAARNTSFLEPRGPSHLETSLSCGVIRVQIEQVGRLHSSRNACGEEFRWPITSTWGLAHFHCRTTTSGNVCQPFPAFASRSLCPSCPTLGHPRPKSLTTRSLTAASLMLVKALRTENGRARVCALDLIHGRSFGSQARQLKFAI